MKGFINVTRTLAPKGSGVMMFLCIRTSSIAFVATATNDPNVTLIGLLGCEDGVTVEQRYDDVIRMIEMAEQ